MKSRDGDRNTIDPDLFAILVLGYASLKQVENEVDVITIGENAFQISHSKESKHTLSPKNKNKKFYFDCHYHHLPCHSFLWLH